MMYLVDAVAQILAVQPTWTFEASVLQVMLMYLGLPMLWVG
jgi:hypothetical protein